MITNQKLVCVLCFLFATFSAAVGQKSQCKGGASCIPVATCTGLYEQLLRGTTPALTKLLQSLHCGFEGADMPKICCPPQFLLGAQHQQQPQQLPQAQRRQQSSQQGRTPDRSSLLPSSKVCGIQTAGDRIYGGVRTELDEHPWMTLLRYDKNSARTDWGFYCGGVLISSRYVLTAAHCVKGADLPTSWKLSQVRLGEWNTSTMVDCISDDCNLPPVDVPVEEIIAHESYDPQSINQHHDIALLRLARHVNFTAFITPICLPLSNDLRSSTFLDSELEVAGWGKTETRTESDVKLKVKVPVVSLSSCATVYQKVNRQLANTQLCAGGVSGQDSCRGDSGGPLMGQTTSAENWIVIGVVSYGPSPCGSQGWPGVYTRVGAYVDWILSKMRP